MGEKEQTTTTTTTTTKTTTKETHRACLVAPEPKQSSHEMLTTNQGTQVKAQQNIFRIDRFNKVWKGTGDF